jgi:hypothetical protein
MWCPKKKIKKKRANVFMVLVLGGQRVRWIMLGGFPPLIPMTTSDNLYQVILILEINGITARIIPADYAPVRFLGSLVHHSSKRLWRTGKTTSQNKLRPPGEVSGALDDMHRAVGALHKAIMYPDRTEVGDYLQDYFQFNRWSSRTVSARDGPVYTERGPVMCLWDFPILSRNLRTDTTGKIKGHDPHSFSMDIQQESGRR